MAEIQIGKPRNLHSFFQEQEIFYSGQKKNMLALTVNLSCIEVEKWSSISRFNLVGIIYFVLVIQKLRHS